MIKKINFKKFSLINKMKSNSFSKKYFDIEELKVSTNKALDIISKEYKKFESNSRVFPDVKPGFLRSQLPDKLPEKAEDIDTILKDTEKMIIPGMTHWQHPKFFAFFPANITHNVLVADMIANAFSAPGFTWHGNPAATELENIVMDWIVDLLNLPEKFMIKNTGGGTLANTVGDALYLSVTAAKHKKMKEMKIDSADPSVLKFVGYYTEHSHIQQHKALCLKDIPYKRALPVEYDETTKNFKLKEGFEKIIEEDLQNGLIPFWLGCTIGTTSSGAQDDVHRLSEICGKYNLFLTVDMAWAGSYLALPEYRNLAQNLEKANSFVINLGKMMLAGLSSASFYVDDKFLLTESLSGKNSQLYLNPEYLKNQFSDQNDVIDYKDWQIGLGRKFNALKIWYLLRSFGREGLQEFLRHTINLAKTFEDFIVKDSRFELVTKLEFSLVCFRLIKYKDNTPIPKEKLNEVNQQFLNHINSSAEVFIVGSKVNDVYFLRGAFGTPNQTVEDVEFLYSKIVESLDEF